MFLNGFLHNLLMEKDIVTIDGENNIRKKSKKINYWLVLSVVLILVLVGLLFLPNNLTCYSISETKAGELMEDYLNGLVGGGVELIEVNDEGSLYEILVLYQNQEIPVYMTKDGEYFIQGIDKLSGEVIVDTPTNTQTQSNTEYSEEDLEKVKEFIGCLKESNFVVYGANWCGYTKQVVDLFGGFDIISPIYVECVGQEQWCYETEGVQGYPTIKVSGEDYSGARNFEAFAQATGCVAPQLNGSVAATNSQASC